MTLINRLWYIIKRSYSPADFLCTHVEQDVSGRQAKSHTVDQQGAGVRDQDDTLQGIKTHQISFCRKWEFPNIFKSKKRLLY